RSIAVLLDVEPFARDAGEAGVDRLAADKGVGGVDGHTHGAARAHVGAGAATERVLPGPGDQRVIAVATGQDIVAGAAADRVVTGAAVDEVVAAQAVDDVVPEGAGDDVGAIRAHDGHVEAVAHEGVVAGQRDPAARGAGGDDAPVAPLDADGVAEVVLGRVEVGDEPAVAAEGRVERPVHVEPRHG